MKERVTVVTGEKGAFVADTVSGDLTFYENGTVATEWESMAAFRGRLRGQHDPLRHRQARAAARSSTRRSATRSWALRNDIVTMREGLDTLAVAEAVLESATQSGRWSSRRLVTAPPAFEGR